AGAQIVTESCTRTQYRPGSRHEPLHCNSGAIMRQMVLNEQYWNLTPFFVGTSCGAMPFGHCAPSGLSLQLSLTPFLRRRPPGWIETFQAWCRWVSYKFEMKTLANTARTTIQLTITNQ
ncbi:MAG: hypothetical protein M3Q42_11660, partial [Pseudomonadota bacterium]|nr:hypothetical protein [Pseudomonadota bacterium]